MVDYMVHEGKLIPVPWMLWIGSKKHHPAADRVGAHNFPFVPSIFRGYKSDNPYSVCFFFNLDSPAVFGVQG